MVQHVDFAIVGGGFAGLSAALTLVSVNRTTAIFDSRNYRNQATAHVHTIAGHDGRTPQELRDMIRANVNSVNGKVYTEYDQKVDEIKAEGTGPTRKFTIVADGQDVVEARAIILTTGIKEIMTIPGAEECWAKGLYHCPACFSTEVFGKTGAILGLDQVFKGHLLFDGNLSGKFAVLLNGVPVPPPMQSSYDTLKSKGHEMIEPAVERLEYLGKEGVRVHFKDGSTPREFGMIAHQPPRELQARHLIDSLGLKTKPHMSGGQMVEQQTMFGMEMGMTTVEGVHVAGDMCEMITIASVALASGAKAAAIAANIMTMAELGLKMPTMPPPPAQNAGAPSDVDRA